MQSISLEQVEESHVIEWIHDLCVWQENLSWSQAIALVLFIIAAVIFVLNWDVVDEEFGYARHQEDAEAKSKAEAARKL